MPETIIESLLEGNAAQVIKWLNNTDHEDSILTSSLLNSSKTEFVAYFLSYLRSQTDGILQTNSNAMQVLQLQNTPEKILNSRRKHRRSISDPINDSERSSDNLLIRSDRDKSLESPNLDKKKTGRKVKTKLFNEEIQDLSISGSINQSSDESRLSVGVDKLALSSTPLKNGSKPDFSMLSFTSPVTPKSFNSFERADTPRLGYRHSKSQEKSCLGDYLVIAQPRNAKKKKSTKNNVSSETDNESKGEIDLSNSEIFPEIGTKKTVQFKSEKKRIKPTNIDLSIKSKSASLNSFNSECFQQPSPLHLGENQAFRYQKTQPREVASGFDAERKLLKQERHKLMEKFNILNTNTSPKPLSPQIKINTQESFQEPQNFIEASVNDVWHKDKIDILIEIYDILIKNNLILSINTEIYFLISTLLSKQCEDDLIKLEKDMNSTNISSILLKTIHNCTYFAVKSLWNQRSVLELVLDRSSLKILGENKRVRNFHSDLAKFLLNLYGVRCEMETSQEKNKTLSDNNLVSNGIVCFNFETDNVDNFPSQQSFQNFKKQRDMFYEILRWYTETEASGTGVPRMTLRSRAKVLLSAGSHVANYAHLAALLTAHMLAECLPSNAQESKLSKLQRRLTCPAQETQNLQSFSAKEKFYKKLVSYCESESFRTHVRDAMSSELCSLDQAHIPTDNSTTLESSKMFALTSRKLRLLAKFLGYLTSLPYANCSAESSSKTANVLVVPKKDTIFTSPNEKVLENSVNLRRYNQPIIDVHGMLLQANKNGRLCLTIPWLVQYLSMLDYTSLRIKYYQEIIQHLHKIYFVKLNTSTQKHMNKMSIIYLKSTLGSLFDQPHFPHEFIYGSGENVVMDIALDAVAVDASLDGSELVDEALLLELCPALKEVNVLLATCKVSQGQRVANSFRHITPVSLALNLEERVKNKEKELQARIEEEYLKSQPSSTRRVLEMAVERVTASCLKEVTSALLAEARDSSSEQALALVRAHAQLDQSELLQKLRQMYDEQLSALRERALERFRALAAQRLRRALSGLLPPAPVPFAVGMRAALRSFHAWWRSHAASPAILCRDVEAQMRTHAALGEARLGPQRRRASTCRASPAALLLPPRDFRERSVSPALVIMGLKELICLLLEQRPTPELVPLLSSAAVCCSAENLFSTEYTVKAIMQLSVDLCVVFVSQKPKDVNDALLSKLNAIWSTCCPDRKPNVPEELDLPERREGLSPELRNFSMDERAITPISDEEIEIIDIKNEKSVINTPTSIINASKSVINASTSVIKASTSVINSPKSVGDLSKSVISDSSFNDSQLLTDGSRLEECQSELLNFFDRLLCPRNIALLCDSNCEISEIWDAMARALVFLLSNDYLSEDSLTEQCLAVYRQDWPQSTLEGLSSCMKSVSSRWSRSSVGKFTLFLDFLAEYCGDMDCEGMLD